MNIEQQRAAFEAWISAENEGEYGSQVVLLLQRNALGDYNTVRIHAAWEAWKAAIEIDRQGRGEPSRRKFLEGFAEADGCFRAAYIEGLAEALSETTDARLKDLIERRVLYAHYAIVEAISHPTNPTIKESLTVAEPAKEVIDADIHELLGQYGDHHVEHGRIVFDKWTLAEAGRALLASYGKAAQSAEDRSLGIATLKDVDAMIRMLRAGEWAEHVGSTPMGRSLEDAITKLRRGC